MEVRPFKPEKRLENELLPGMVGKQTLDGKLHASIWPIL